MERVRLPFLNTYRTMCIAPEPPLKQLLEEKDEHGIFRTAFIRSKHSTANREYRRWQYKFPLENIPWQRRQDPTEDPENWEE